jgi:hypothetical protein
MNGMEPRQITRKLRILWVIVYAHIFDRMTINFLKIILKGQRDS